MAETTFGKVAEERIKTWLDRPQEGYSIDRIPDQVSGYYLVSRNICDFTFYKAPYMHYIESKATEHDRFEFSQLTNTQRDGLRLKAEIPGCYGLVIVLFVYSKRAFIFNIKDIVDFINPDSSLQEIQRQMKDGIITSELKVKSLNITKIDKWEVPYWEIKTIPSRKQLLEYTGEFPDLSVSSK